MLHFSIFFLRFAYWILVDFLCRLLKNLNCRRNSRSFLTVNEKRERDREKENTHKTDDNRREHNRDYIRIECKAHWVDNLVGILLWLSGIWISVCRVYFVHLSVRSVGPQVLVNVSTKGKNTKNSRLSWGIKIQKTVRMVQPLREVFGLLGWVLVAQLRCPEMMLDVFAVIYKMNRNDNDNIDHEQRELYIDFGLVSFFVFEWSSGVLYTRSWSARREWLGENELYFTHHGQKTKKIGGVRATTTTLLRNRCVRETDREASERTITDWLSVHFDCVSGQTPLLDVAVAVCCLWCLLVALLCGWCMASHSRVRLIYTLIVVVGRHGPTAGHHHIIGIDLWIVGIATAAYHHVVGIDLHIIVDRRLWRRGWRWRWRRR